MGVPDFALNAGRVLGVNVFGEDSGAIVDGTVSGAACSLCVASAASCRLRFVMARSARIARPFDCELMSGFQLFRRLLLALGRRRAEVREHWAGRRSTDWLQMPGRAMSSLSIWLHITHTGCNLFSSCGFLRRRLALSGGRTLGPEQMPQRSP